MSNNGEVLISSNHISFSPDSFSRPPEKDEVFVTLYGGAIYGSTITLNDNGSVTFSGNSVSSSHSDSSFLFDVYGGAIYGSTITLNDNSSVTFSGNTSGTIYGSACGGAIYGDSNSSITLSDNGSVTFSGNTSSSIYGSAFGGAIYGDSNSSITLSDNGSVQFSGNTVSTYSYSGSGYGGAIYGSSGSTITLSDNGSVTFSGNSARVGGAIYTGGNLNVCNNDTVLFEKNVQISGSSYRLRSIYVYGGSEDAVSLPAAAGTSIEFRDSLYIGSGTIVNLNADYGDSEQKGDIIFTGKYTETHLNEILAADGLSRLASTSEISNSRTTVVNAMTNLYGGRLRVEDGAIYQGQGITAHEDSAATVRVQNATLSHAGYDLTFNSGTMLELIGSNSISGNLNLLAGSTLHIDYAGNETATTLNGFALALTGDSFLRLTGSGNGDGKTYTLLTGVSGLVDAQGNDITQNSSNNAISHYFDTTQPGTGFWADATLVLNEGTLQLVRHNESVKEAVTITTYQGDCADYRYYEGVVFENIKSDISPSWSDGNDEMPQSRLGGGVIYISEGGSISLSDNGSVQFNGNGVTSSQSAEGGAIYGEGSTITLNDNGSVLFTENSAGRGGAIAYHGILLELCNNGSVVFRENKADSYGAIFGCDGDILINQNGCVEFIGNIAAGTASAIGVINGNIIINQNGSVTFSGNSARVGGAIYTGGNLSLQNNDSVLFEKNAQVSNGTYRLRSIYYDSGSDDVILLSAMAGKSIEFRDSVYIGSDATVNLNADCGEIKQQGDIIFTGKYTETHLNELLAANEAGRTATAEEILNSRTTEVNTLTNLYGGRLRVEEGAIYQGRGITAHEGSAATVRVQNATLSHAGYDLTFNSGTTLELVGNNIISGNVQMLEGSTLSFTHDDALVDRAAMSLSGSLTMADGTTLQLSGFDGRDGAFRLMELADASLTGWSDSGISIVDADGTAISWNRIQRYGDTVYYVSQELETAIWTNASGDGKWNNQSYNWEEAGKRYAFTQGENVVFDSATGGNIEMVGDLHVSNMQVQSGGSYTYSGDSTLNISNTLEIANGAAADICLAGGVVVDGSVESAGELKVNRISGAGNINITGGSLELADDTDALAVGGSVRISNAELCGTWTGSGLSIGSSSVAAGAEVILKDVTFTSALSNEGKLTLGGMVTVQADGLSTATSTTRYSAGQNGYSYTEKNYTLVTGDGSTAAQTGTEWSINGDATIPVNADYSYANGILSVTGAQDHTAYWVNGTVTYDGRSEFATADTLVLNGGNLSLNTGLGGNLSSGIRVDAAGTLTVGSGVQLARAALNGISATNKVTLQGSGRLDMGSSADFTGMVLGTNWSGTVSLVGITSNTNLNMNTIGCAGATIELENVKGYTGVKGNTVAANLVLKKFTTASGTEQAAFHISDGYSDTTAGYVMTTFNGRVSGDGKIVFDKSLTSEHTGFAFTGNVAGWTGAFEMNAGKTFNLVFKENASTIKADIRDISSSGTLNLILGADSDMTLSGAISTDSISVSSDVDVSFGGTVNTGSLSAVDSVVTFGADTAVTGDIRAAGVELNPGASLDVGGTLSTDRIILNELSSVSPTLTVGSFAAGDAIFALDADTLNALKLGHGESVVIARADSSIGSDFAAWLSEASTTMDAAVYRYDISVSGTDVLVSMAYANWGTRVWYGNTWVGMEDWKVYATEGYDAVDGTESVDLGGAAITATEVYFAPSDSATTTVLLNGSMTAECTQIVNGKLTIASGTTLETDELEADGKEILLQGELIVNKGSIGTLSGTTGDLVIGGELSVGSNVTLGGLDNSGFLDIGAHKLNVASPVTNGGNVTAGEVVVHNRYNSAAEFNTLIADKVTVTNSSSSASYSDNLSVGDGSAIGVLVAESLEVRGGSVTLGRTNAATEQTLQNLKLQSDATLVLNQQTVLAVTDTLSATEHAKVQLKQDAALNYGVLSIINRGAADAAELKPAGLADSSAVISNAHVAVDSSEATSVGFQMNNCSIENAGSGKLTVTGTNADVNAIYATGGDIELLYRDASLTLEELLLNDNTSVAVYKGCESEKEQQSDLSAGRLVSFGNNVQLHANLTINSGAELNIDSPVQLSGALSLNNSLTLGGNLLMEIQQAEVGSSINLFTGIELLRINMEEFNVLTLNAGLESSLLFNNLQNTDDRFYYMVYDCPKPGAGVLSIRICGFSVPEPATTTLSLLTLAALAAYRRRQA